MVVDWEQETGLLMSSGDVRIVRIWDTDRETKVQVTAALLHSPDAVICRETDGRWHLAGRRQANLLWLHSD